MCGAVCKLFGLADPSARDRHIVGPQALNHVCKLLQLPAERAFRLGGWYAEKGHTAGVTVWFVLASMHDGATHVGGLAEGV